MLDISGNDIFQNYFPKAPTTNSRPSSISTPDKLYLPKDRMKAKGNTDIEGFTNRVKSLLDKSWEDGWGEFTIENPTGQDADNLNFPIVTFDVVKRIPSTGKIGLKARPTEAILDPENADYTLILHRRWFDCIGEFTVFHRTNKEVRSLLTRLEMFLETYRGFFKDEGVSELIFKEEIDPRLALKFKDGIPSGTLQYLIVIERIVVERTRTTKEIRSKIKEVQSI